MARKSGRAALLLSEESWIKLSALAASRTAPVREAERAGVLLKYAEGLSITEIQRQLGVSRPLIYKCVDKALAGGVQQGLKDAYHRPHAPEITEGAKLGSSVWPVQSRRNWDGRRNCGVFRHGRARCPSMRKRLVLRVFPRTARAPAGAFWTRTI